MTGLCGKLSPTTKGMDHNAEENCVTKREGKCPIMAQMPLSQSIRAVDILTRMLRRIGQGSIEIDGKRYIGAQMTQ